MHNKLVLNHLPSLLINLTCSYYRCADLAIMSCMKIYAVFAVVEVYDDCNYGDISAITISIEHH